MISYFLSPLMVLTLSATCCLTSILAQGRPSAAGHWEGAINIPGMRLHVIVDLSRREDGTWSGAIDIPAQGAKDLPLTNIIVRGFSISFELTGPPGHPSFKGQLSQDGQTLSGDFTQSGQTFPFSLQRKAAAGPGTATEPTSSTPGKEAPADRSLSHPPPGKGVPGQGLEGIWQGTLEVRGSKLRLVLRVSKAPDGTLSGTLDSLDQGAMNLPIDRMTLKDGTLRFEMKNIGAVYEGRLSRHGSDISGQWSQGGVSLPLTFRRTAKAPELTRPQEPKKPYPYREEEVVYENPKAGIKLAGTLTLPRSNGPFPAVLLISGSGPQDRNETVFGHRPFLILADYLTRRGIAVLRVDDRGVGGSTGRAALATSQDLAGDVLAGVNVLKRRPEINPKQIGLIGHSEGGLIAPLAAVRSADVAFIVLIAGPGLPVEQILYQQAELIAKASGADNEAVALNRRLQERIFAILREEKDNQVAEKRIRQSVAEMMADLPKEQKKVLERMSGTLEGQLKMVLSPWFRFFLTYDPGSTLMKVKCPVLAVSGARDLQVPTRKNLPAIAEALEAGGNSDYTIVKLANLNHLLQTCQTGSPSEYAKIEETMAPVALQVIADWILWHTTTP